jgi:hypothetical protein
MARPAPSSGSGEQLRGAAPFERHKLVNAKHAPISPQLFEQGTRLYADEVEPPPPPIARLQRPSRLANRVWIGLGLVIAGAAIGVLMVIASDDRDPPPGNPHNTEGQGLAPQPPVIAPVAPPVVPQQSLRQGTLILRTVPPGATVRVDGDVLPGSTPLSLSLPMARTTQIEISLLGYQTQTFAIAFSEEVQALERTVELVPMAVP